MKDTVLDNSLFAPLAPPQVRYIGIPRCDLVHSRHVLLNRFPWVVDVEDVTAFAWYRRKVLGKRWARRLLEWVFSSPYCRMILPWTNAARSSLENMIDCSAFRGKIRIVYPAIAPVGFARKAKSDKRVVRFLFIGSGLGFYAKGGMETLLAFDRLCRQYENASLTMVAYVPASVRERFAGNPKITFLQAVPTGRLRQEFEGADVFILPTHMDTFGFVYLEAFARGIPCIGTAQFSVPEIITDGVTGLLVKPDHSYFGPDFLPAYDTPIDYAGHPLFEGLRNPSQSYVGSLTEKMTLLLENVNMRLAMSEAAYEEVISGKFSVGRRRKVLGELYEQCLVDPVRDMR